MRTNQAQFKSLEEDLMTSPPLPFISHFVLTIPIQLERLVSLSLPPTPRRPTDLGLKGLQVGLDVLQLAKGVPHRVGGGLAPPRRAKADGLDMELEVLKSLVGEELQHVRDGVLERRGLLPEVPVVLQISRTESKDLASLLVKLVHVCVQASIRVSRIRTLANLPSSPA